ncbi:hypothetical protein SISSUDRAFT_1049596 [Sistotremastrum suecicum HHB10207 ss-3]|uniref:F-box domain-containing protein n=1 Tax=Sistotremastrum suecicum HHB10207 ss-3 TaxID=1314776 RepID=A0A166BRB2_9AGAM|nr:hypothetical protein SISSUDRAFT_1049596 [Sistotremastrum suecicum HHB10207 ss-3]
MTFLGCHDEIQSEILQWVFEDSHLWESLEYLRYLEGMRLINRQLNKVVLECGQLWSTVHLDWPESVLLAHHARSKDCELAVFFNTNVEGSAATRPTLARCAKFLADNMGRTYYLDATIANGTCIGALANAIATTPAPRLETLKLYLGDRVNNVHRMFADNAPRLRDAAIHRGPFKHLHHISTLTKLEILVTQAVGKKLVTVLQDMPQLEEVLLVGDQSIGEATGELSIQLPNCKKFTLKNMPTNYARHILLHVGLRTDTHVHVGLLLSPNDVSSGVFQFLPSYLPPPIKAAKSLMLQIRPETVIIQADSFPPVAFSIDYTALHEALLERDEGALETFAGILSFLALSPSMNPEKLVIYNAPPSETETTFSSIAVTGIPAVWDQLYTACDLVEQVQFFGDLAAPVASLRQLVTQGVSVLPKVWKVDIGRGGRSQSTVDDINYIAHARRFAICAPTQAV